MLPPVLRTCPRVSVLVGAILGTILPFGTPTVVAQEAWPMAGRDPAHGGTVESAPQPPYGVAWEREVGAGGPVTGVAASGETVAVVTGRGVFALDAASGEVLWERGRPAGPSGVPAIARGMVIHARDDGVSSQLVARDERSGDIVWQAALDSGAAGGPTVAEDTVFVGTLGGQVVALDLATGEEVWRFRTLGGVAGAPAVGNGVLAASAYQPRTGRSTLYALDAAAGGEDGPMWTHEAGPVGPISAPAIGAGRVYAGIGDAVRAFALDSGAELWTSVARSRFGVRQVPAASDELLIPDLTHLFSLDPGTGEERWTHLLADLTPMAGGAVQSLVTSSPAIGGNVVLMGRTDGTLSAIELRGGHEIWRMDLGEEAVGHLAIGSELLYVPTLGEHGRVVALAHDPEGRLIDEVSLSVLFVGEALLNFALAALLVGAVILLLFRFALRARRETSP